MLLRILVPLSVLLLLVAIGLCIRILRNQKLQYLKTSEQERRRQVMNADLGDEIVWNRADVIGDTAQFSRRRFVPNFLAGVAALLLFRIAARGMNIEQAAKGVRGFGKHREASTFMAARPEDDHEDTHTDRTPHIDTHFDHDDAAVPHADSHEDHNDHYDSHHDHDDF